MQQEHSRKEAQPAEKDIHDRIKQLEEKIKRLERIYAARQALIDQFRNGVTSPN